MSNVYQHILVATDGSETADRAVEAAIALAQSLRAKLRVVCVVDEMPATFDLPAAIVDLTRSALIDACRSALAEARDKARDAGLDCETQLIDDAAPAGPHRRAHPAVQAPAPHALEAHAIERVEQVVVDRSASPARHRRRAAALTCINAATRVCPHCAP